MTREALDEAASHLRTASDAAGGDASDRLGDLSDQLADLATQDSGPDHGRLARIQNKLHDLDDEVGDEAAAAIEDGNDAINAYRETLEGV